jgi:anti-sigma factor RsiW
LMYEDGGGRRVTLYVRRGHPNTDSAFRLVSEDGVGEFY